MIEKKVYIFKDRPYQILTQTKIKLYDELGMNGKWQDVIIYKCLYVNTDGMIWVRFKEDFYANFKLKK